MSKLILTNEVTGLGSAGDIVEVKDGYARNYLIPQGFAVKWTRGSQKQVDAIKAAREARAIANRDDAVALQNKLEEATVRVPVKAGKEGRLFGSVKTADIADAVEAAGLGQIDKRKIELNAPIKAVGKYTATVKLHDDVAATLNLQVIAAK